MAPAFTLKRVWIWLVSHGPLIFGDPFTQNFESLATEFGFYSVGWRNMFAAQKFLGKGQESQKGHLSLWYQRTHFVGLWKWTEMVEKRQMVAKCSVYISSLHPLFFLLFPSSPSLFLFFALVFLLLTIIPGNRNPVPFLLFNSSFPFFSCLISLPSSESRGWKAFRGTVQGENGETILRSGIQGAP